MDKLINLTSQQTFFNGIVELEFKNLPKIISQLLKQACKFCRNTFFVTASFPLVTINRFHKPFISQSLCIEESLIHYNFVLITMY